jgi:serine/threonine protein kinase
MPPPELEELLRAYRAALERGEPATPEQICRDHPQLLGDFLRQLESARATDVPQTQIPDPVVLAVTRPDLSATAFELQAGVEPVAGYKLVRLLGRGGFGEVWEALAPGGFRVAFKFVSLDGGTGEVELQALEIIRNLRHPNLLAVFGTWQSGGWLVIGMELADATLLDELHKAGDRGLPRRLLVRWSLDTARVVDYLNKPRHFLGGAKPVGIQHGDIKPQNILLVGAGVKVGDFGLVRLLRASVEQHQGGMTPLYAAPEVLDGRVSRWSDQYSLAVTWCQLRGGRLPFTGADVNEVRRKKEHAPDLSMLPAEERPSVARALASDPRARWPDCRAFIKALAECRGTAVVRAATPRVSMPVEPTTVTLNTSPPLIRAAEDRPLPGFTPARAGLPTAGFQRIFLAAVVVFCAISVGVIVLGLGSVRQAYSPDESHAARDQSFAEAKHARADEMPAAKSAVVNPPTPREKVPPPEVSVRAVPTHRKTRSPIDSQPTAAAAPVPPPIESAAPANVNSPSPTPQPTPRPAAEPGPVLPEPRVEPQPTPTAPTVSPPPPPASSIPSVAIAAALIAAAGLLIATAWRALRRVRRSPVPELPRPEAVALRRERHHAHLRRSSAPELPRPEAESTSAPQVELVPAGSETPPLDESRPSAIAGPPLISPARGLAYYAGHTDAVWAVAVSPNDTLVLSGGMDNGVRLWDYRTLGEHDSHEDHSEGVTAVAFSPDRRLAFSGSLDGSVLSWSLTAEDESRQLARHPGRVLGIACSADGRTLASCGEDGTIRLLDARGGGESGQLQGHVGWVYAVVYAGDRLLSAGGDGTVRLWSTETGAALARMQGHAGAVRCLAVNPDGTRAASGGEDKSVILWDLESGQELLRFSAHSDWVRAVAWTADGRYLVTGSDDETLCVSDAASGKTVQRVEVQGASLLCIAVTPHGRSILVGCDDAKVRVFTVHT